MVTVRHTYPYHALADDDQLIPSIEEFPALSVRCDVKWSESTTDLEIYPYDPSDVLYHHTAEQARTTMDTKPASELRPSSSTNTFCVPDDDESDMGEVKVNQISPFKVGDGDITVLYDESNHDSSRAPYKHELSLDSDPHDSECDEVFPSEGSFEEYSESSNGEESNGKGSEFDSDPSSFSQDSDDGERVEYTIGVDLPLSALDDNVSGSESDSDAECDADYDDEYSVGQDEDEEECIDPSMLIHKDNLATTSLIGAIQNPGGFFPKPYFKVDVQEQGPTAVQNQPMTFPSHFPLTPITPTLEHKREEDDGSQRLGRLSICDMLNNYQDGPFAGPNDSTPKEVSSEEEVVTESPSLASLKRKASEMESQDAQIPDSIVPPSEKVDLETISQSQVAEAISSALSECSDTEPPKKRVKATHDTSNKIASYTATAVISALLGGLGTIALLAALPAEYFQ